VFNSDRLLYVLSAKKEINSSAFKEAFDYLDTNATDLDRQGIKKRRSEVIRSLDALGHCDFDFSNGYRVYVAPPALVRLPCAGFPQAVLTGARSPNTIQKIEEACKSVGNHIKHDVEPDDALSLIPRRITIQAEDIEELRQISDLLKIHFLETPSAWTILHFVGSLDDYLDTLKWCTTRELNWQRQTFNPSSLQFEATQDVEADTRLSQYSHPKQNTMSFYLWRNGQMAEIERDWGRYAVLKAMRSSVLFYDKRKFMMAVPISAKLPRLLERALTLCSGFVPEYRNKSDSLSKILPKVKGFNLFTAIPPQIAEMTAAKLSQTLKTLDI